MVSRQTGFPKSIAQLIWLRDRGACARCGRGLVRDRRSIDWAIHHREPRGRFGIKGRPWVNLPANGVCLCAVCHIEVEADRKDAIATGWLVSALGVTRAAEIAIPHALHGMVWLDDEGGVRAS